MASVGPNLPIASKSRGRPPFVIRRVIRPDFENGVRESYNTLNFSKIHENVA